MFNRCTSLSSIKCLATDISTSDCTTDWVTDVAASGIFTKDAETDWPDGAGGIPCDWTVEDA